MKRTYSITTATILGLAAATSAKAAMYGPVSWSSFGADNGPGVLITYNGGTSFSVTTTGQGPYDSVEDTYVGVVNASTTQSLSSVNLTASTDIFGFDGDGIDTYRTAGNNFTADAQDTSGYGGPDTWFTVNSLTSGTANFSTPIAPGGSTFFSLEEPLTGANGGGGLTAGAPDACSSMALLGGALAGIGALRRKFKA